MRKVTTLEELEIWNHENVIKQRRDKVMELLKQFCDELQFLNKNEEIETINNFIHHVEQGLFEVSIVGGFAVGKYTLLAALMHNDLRLDSRMLPRTTIGKTNIVNSDESRVILSFRNDNLKKVINLNDLTELWCGELDVDYSELKEITIEYPLPIDHVKFVVNPPIGTLGCDSMCDIHKADAIVFVMHATRPFTKSDKEYIQKYFERRNLKNIYVVVNWWNMVKLEEREDVKAEVKRELQLVFEDENGNFDEKLFNERVFYVDAYSAKCYRMGESMKYMLGAVEREVILTKEDEIASGILDVENSLYAYLFSSGQDIVSYNTILSYMQKIHCDEAKKLLSSALRGIAENNINRDDYMKKTAHIEKLAHITEELHALLNRTDS